VHEGEVVVAMMSIMVFAGVAILWMAMNSRQRYREMEHRERLAMIERGVVPSPEKDPVAFEQRMMLGPASPRASRTRSAGTVIVGLGFGLMVLITFAAGEPEMGFGIGGAFVAIGAAFMVNAMLSARDDRYRPYVPGRDYPLPPPRSAPRQEPPSNYAP
jgi:hypothetical protein